MDGVTYVKDERGNDVAVVVPIAKWKAMVEAEREDAALAKRARKADRSVRIPVAFVRRDLAGAD
jgi:hypothetical protein